MENWILTEQWIFPSRLARAKRTVAWLASIRAWLRVLHAYALSKIQSHASQNSYDTIEYIKNEKEISYDSALKVVNVKWRWDLNSMWSVYLLSLKSYNTFSWCKFYSLFENLETWPYYFLHLDERLTSNLQKLNISKVSPEEKTFIFNLKYSLGST